MFFSPSRTAQRTDIRACIRQKNRFPEEILKMFRQGRSLAEFQVSGYHMSHSKVKMINLEPPFGLLFIYIFLVFLFKDSMIYDWIS
jgi:hypothetical protein